MKKHAILPANVLGHSDIAPARKQDPGELFPWEALAAEGVGIWPEPDDADRAAAPTLLSDRLGFHQKLIEFGYDAALDFEILLTAFHRHFYPEKFLKGENPAIPDAETAARLLALLRISR